MKEFRSQRVWPIPIVLIGFFPIILLVYTHTIVPVRFDHSLLLAGMLVAISFFTLYVAYKLFIEHIRIIFGKNALTIATQTTSTKILYQNITNVEDTDTVPYVGSFWYLRNFTRGLHVHYGVERTYVISYGYFSHCWDELQQTLSAHMKTSKKFT